MTKAELQKAFLHRLPVVYTPIVGDPMRYQYIEAIEYTTDRFGVFALGVALHNRNSTTHVLAERVEIEDEKERKNANERPCPFEMPDNFPKYVDIWKSCQHVIANIGGKKKLYNRITQLTVKLDYYGNIIFTVTVGKDTDTHELNPEDVEPISNEKILRIGN